MSWLFYLDDIEIDEPVGWEQLELSIKRHDTYHGMVFEAALGTLEFYGTAYTYLKNKKESEGILANVIFSAYANCEGYDYEEMLSGRLNFGKYKENCGTKCTIMLPWEEDSCEVVLKSRDDQRVDMDKTSGVDGVSPLGFYNALGQEIELPAHGLRIGTEGYVEDAGDAIDVSIFAEAFAKSWVRPTYNRRIDESLDTSQLVPAVNAASNNGFNDSVLSPQLLLEEIPACNGGEFDYEVRLKGSFDIQYTRPGFPDPPVTSVLRFVGGIGKGEFNANQAPETPFPGALTILDTEDIDYGSDLNHWVGTFDITFTGTASLLIGEGFYAFITWEPSGPFSGVEMVGNITFDKETYIKVNGVRSCPATTAETYMIHESLSRIAEAITNGCMRVKSSYYGRVDSEPFSFSEDGCGGLRSLTSGLKIRKAENDKFFASFKEMIEGLNAIDNIGYDVIDDQTVQGNKVLRIESVDFFYENAEVLRHDGISGAVQEVEEGRHYSNVLVGYKKWEVEDVNGLDEFNSNRQFNTSFDTIKSPLDITSGLIAGTYPIEITRQQSFATTGAADTKYDNDIFILCMRRTTYPYGNVEIELGNIDNPQNIFDPATIYNFRISPMRNLMRWYKTIAAGFVSLYNTVSKLFFISGTGNLTASGEMEDETCKLEATSISENQNLFITHFTDSSKATPLWRPETISYEYPMSLGEYKQVKLYPYRYVSAQCGNGDFIKYWIQEIKYKVSKGKATFVLRKKYAQ